MLIQYIAGIVTSVRYLLTEIAVQQVQPQTFALVVVDDPPDSITHWKGVQAVFDRKCPIFFQNFDLTLEFIDRTIPHYGIHILGVFFITEHEKGYGESYRLFFSGGTKTLQRSFQKLAATLTMIRSLGLICQLFPISPKSFSLNDQFVSTHAKIVSKCIQDILSFQLLGRQTSFSSKSVD